MVRAEASAAPIQAQDLHRPKRRKKRGKGALDQPRRCQRLPLDMRPRNTRPPVACSATLRFEAVICPGRCRRPRASGSENFGEASSNSARARCQRGTGSRYGRPAEAGGSFRKRGEGNVVEARPPRKSAGVSKVADPAPGCHLTAG